MFIITEYETYDDLVDAAVELELHIMQDHDVDDFFAEPQLDEEDNLYEIINDLYYEKVDVISNAEQLKHWWLVNGWTLDRGYGGPNYKERIAEDTDWDSLYELLSSFNEVEPSFGEVRYSPTEVNDFVIFIPHEDIEE